MTSALVIGKVHEVIRGRWMLGNESLSQATRNKIELLGSAHLGPLCFAKDISIVQAHYRDLEQTKNLAPNVTI